MFATVEVNDAPVGPDSIPDVDHCAVQLLDTNRRAWRFFPAPGRTKPVGCVWDGVARQQAGLLGNKSSLCGNPVTNSGGIGDPRLAGPGIHGDVVLQQHDEAARPVQFPPDEVVHADSRARLSARLGLGPGELTLNGQVQDCNGGRHPRGPHPQFGGQSTWAVSHCTARWAPSFRRVHHERGEFGTQVGPNPTTMACRSS